LQINPRPLKHLENKFPLAWVPSSAPKRFRFALTAQDAIALFRQVQHCNPIDFGHVSVFKLALGIHDHSVDVAGYHWKGDKPYIRLSVPAKVLLFDDLVFLNLGFKCTRYENMRQGQTGTLQSLLERFLRLQPRDGMA
jgi:hypothetical protein